MKKLKKFIWILLAAVMITVGTACTENPTPGPGPGEGTGTVKSGTINIFLPIDTDTSNALRAVGNAYTKMMGQKGINVQVKIRASEDPNGYSTAITGLLQNPENQEGDIIQANVATQFYGTDKLVDFTPYLNQKNPYEEDKIWKSTLREDAYRMDGKSQKIYNLSMEGNALVAFYNKAAFEEFGIEVPTDWASFIAALDKFKENGYPYPLGLNFDNSTGGGLEGNNFNWVASMYIDQYFRDMIDAAHSQENDYSYISDLDEGWTFDQSDPLNDAQSQYTYNFTRVVNEYFKDGSKFNTKSARYADLMANMKKLASYASPQYSNSLVRQYFQNDGLSWAEGGKVYEKNLRVGIYLLRLDTIVDYQKSLGGVLQKPNGVIPIDELSDMLGWFELPPMPNNGGEGAPAADNLRTRGGPDHHPLGLVNRDADKTALCIDFLKYLFSTEGFNTYYNYYAQLGKVCAMQVYLKDYELPEAVRISGNTEFDGDCSTNPYNLFATHYSENNSIMADADEVQSLVNDQLRAYLTADAGESWTKYGEEIYRIMTQGFTNYAKWRGLKETSLSYYISDSVDFTTDPMS